MRRSVVCPQRNISLTLRPIQIAKSEIVLLIDLLKQKLGSR